jgi:hypothetical protein
VRNQPFARNSELVGEQQAGFGQSQSTGSQQVVDGEGHCSNSM